MIVCIGIDPSLNSTGLCMVNYDPELDKEYELHFGIIHSGKLTKKESKAEELYLEYFKYYIIDELPKNAAKILDASVFERLKTLKFKSIIDTIKDIINNRNNEYIDRIYVCIEGISYGSTGKTKSIFDLAGLNYMIRLMLLSSFNNKVELIVCPPSHIKKFATGKGNADKNAMLESFKIAFPHLLELPKLDDIADAFFMKEMAKRTALEQY